MNSSDLYSNWTSNSVRKQNPLTLIFLALTIVCFSLFLFFVSLIFHVFFTTAHIRETSRYILFAHMLINDTMYLVVGFALVMTAITASYIPVPICYAIITLASITFRLTPYNLAVMALERYTAVSSPLKHVIVCTPQRAYHAIVFMWVFGLVPNVVDFIILVTSVDKSIFSLNVKCSRETLLVKSIQTLLRSITNIASLSLVGIVITFTYIGVMIVAKRASSRSSLAFKAGKTLILHAFQFLLCLLSLTSPFIEAIFANDLNIVGFANFLFLTCLPRCLSPIIYGMRDRMFSKRIKLLSKISLK
ncbi:odorant receptor 131-2-like [Mantella aurantiaca]